MGRKAQQDEKARPAGDPESEEKKRLRSLAVSKKILRRSPANASAPLEPSKAVVKLQGRDIVKRGQRKSRYLFSFPGLIAPLTGGKIGDLADLATKNPVLYLEFPQGRMKLFGTHVYPKNKYLTLQLTKSAKGVMCEDVFESLIVFSEAWWIGQKEKNPEEYQLEFPKDLKEGKDCDYDFKGGAGATYDEASGGQKSGKEYVNPPSPDNELESDGSDDFSTVISKDAKMPIETTPLRQSARTSRKTLNVSYAESSSEKDSADSDTEAIEVDELRINAEADTKANSPALRTRDDFGVVGPIVCSPENDAIVTKENLAEEAKQTLQKSSRKSPNKKGKLVQARLSSLFEKVADKKSKRTEDDTLGTKSPSGKRQRLLAKEKTDAVMAKTSSNKGKKSRGKSGTGSKTEAMKKRSQEVDDWSDDISSESQNEDEDGDEDWVA
ncbi:DNA-binding protein RHL1 [Dendrobium catenatum]|uniref:DNA-binding protein RHL1 n=1 Tax=Dendrobium catenatum TaxID=906689 RepID=UPI0009F4AA2C|nr:DNA-binding protein RHL1 [Dendrobium catenatum]